jgi:phage shock protein PspC (stress-responsive transcriptional regulator)
MSDHPPVEESSLAGRYGLIRPLQGRYIVGVCAGLGRATRTDPVLWRVVLAVLVCFAGIGAVIYLALWMLTPEEGDTASPVEALFGRGRSSTSPTLVVVVGVACVLLLLLVLPQPLYLVLLGTALVLMVLLLIERSRKDGDHRTAPVAAGSAFAPHGPFAAAPAPPTPMPTPTPPSPPPPPPPPPPVRERSLLPAITFSAVLLVVGALGLADLAGLLDVPAAGYVAAALAVVGGGLVTGAFMGRGRAGLIAVGVVLALVLPVTQAVQTWESPHTVGDITWVPRSPAELDDEYAVLFGAGLLDLSELEVAGDDIAVTVDVAFGDVRIVVPQGVPVEVVMATRFGVITAFGTSSAGVTSSSNLIDDLDADPGRGTLRLQLRATFANVEVER